MIKLELWDKKSDLYPLVGGKQTPTDIFAAHGWTENPAAKVVIEVTGGVWGSIDNLEILKHNFNIETDDDEEALRLIEAILNTPPPPEAPINNGAYDEFIEGLLEGLGVEL